MSGDGHVPERAVRGELTATLWLIAVLLAELLAVVWFFGRVYAT